MTYSFVVLFFIEFDERIPTIDNRFIPREYFANSGEVINWRNLCKCYEVIAAREVVRIVRYVESSIRARSYTH